MLDMLRNQGSTRSVKRIQRVPSLRRPLGVVEVMSEQKRKTTRKDLGSPAAPLRRVETSFMIIYEHFFVQLERSEAL